MPSTERSWFQNQSRSNWEKYIKPLGPFRTYLELGTYCGDSLLWFAENCTLPDKPSYLYAVDPWGKPGTGFGGTTERIDDAERITRKRISEFEKARPLVRFRLHRMTSREFFAENMQRLSGQFQVAFVDGVHYAADSMFDMLRCWDMLCVGGILIVDDIHMRQGLGRRKVPHVGDAWRFFRWCYAGEMDILYVTRRQAACVKKGG